MLSKLTKSDLVSKLNKEPNLIYKKDSCTFICENVPFKYFFIDNVLPQKDYEEIQTILKQFPLFPKSSDLFQFFQSHALSTYSDQLEPLKKKILIPLKTLFEKITGQELIQDDNNLFVSSYKFTDYLLCHDDQLENRKVAFIYYFVPENWEAADGGSLALFDTDIDGNAKNIVKTILPKSNSIAAFIVNEKSFHQVNEVFSKDKNRFSLTGWFTVKQKEFTFQPVKVPKMRSFNNIKKNLNDDGQLLFELLNYAYLDSDSIKTVNQKFVDLSYIYFYNFLNDSIYEQLVKELENVSKNDEIWNTNYHPQFFNYKTMKRVDKESMPTLAKVSKLFKSYEFMFWLKIITSIDFENLSLFKRKRKGLGGVVSPLLSNQIQEFSHKSFSLLYDDEFPQSELFLDVVLTMTDEKWDPSYGGSYMFNSYKDPEDLKSSSIDYEPIIFDPKPNSLFIIFRRNCVHSFTKYINNKVDELNEGKIFRLENIYYIK